MARFETTGFDELIEDMKNHGELTGEIADRMLLAAAEELKKAWKKSAEMHGHKDTGDMINSIKYTRNPKTKKEIRMIDVYPHGKDRKGVRNAEKAFVLHYGTSSMKGSNWVDDAEEMGAEPAFQAMERIWDERLKGK